jgi:ATP-dependent helicase HrpA
MNDGAMHKRLLQCMLSDVHRFRRRLSKLKKPGEGVDAKREQLAAEIERSVARVEARRCGVPAITYPDDLPIAQKHELIRDSILANPVTIL